MRVNVAIPEAHVSKPVLDAALESVTRLNEAMIADGSAPTFDQMLAQGVQWKPEPPGQEHFDHAGIVAHRGHGDCDDLAPAHAASLRASGKDPGARAEVIRSGPHLWHAIVKRSDGSTDDPSKAAGMPTGGVQALHGAVLPLMSAAGSVVGGTYVVRPSLAVRPSPRGFQARVDLPWHWRERLSDKPTPTDVAMTALHSHPVAHTALAGAIVGAIELGQAGGFADPEHIQRLACIAEACEGCPMEELTERWGPEHARAAGQVVGSFFGNIFKAATAPLTSTAHFLAHPSLKNLGHIVTDPVTSAMRAAQPLAHAISPLAHMVKPFASFIPGIGPVAMSAFDALEHGPPTSFGDLAHMAMNAGTNFIPGGSMLSNAMPMLSHMMPGGGGAPHPMAPQMPPQMPPGFAEMLHAMQQQGGYPQAWPAHGFQ
jgi:hypothetical protein